MAGGGAETKTNFKIVIQNSQIKYKRNSNNSTFKCTLGGFSGSSAGKEPSCNAGGLGLIPGLGRSPAEGNSYPLQYSCLGNSMNRGAWQATVHGVTKSLIWLSHFHFHKTPCLFTSTRAGKTTLFHICPFTLNSMSSQPSSLPGASPHPSIPPPGCPLSSPSHPQVGVRCKEEGGDAAAMPLLGNRCRHHPLPAAPQQPLLCSRWASWDPDSEPRVQSSKEDWSPRPD